MLFQVLCGFEPIFYTTHPNEEPKIIVKESRQEVKNLVKLYENDLFTNT